MAGFKSFLSGIGHFFKKEAPLIAGIGAVAAPYLNLVAPGVGTAVGLLSNLILKEEQAATAPGTGAQKSANVIATGGAAVIQLLQQEGITANEVDLQKLIDGIVAVLNAIPAPAAVPV